MSKEDMRPGELDEALAEAEREAWSLFDATHRIKPRAEFAQQLEAQLRLAAHKPPVPAQPQARIQTQPQFATRKALSKLRLFEQGRARLAFVGAALGMAVVLVFGFASYLGNPISTATKPGNTYTKPGEASLMSKPGDESFVPPGMVRRITINHIFSSPGKQDGSLIEEVWLTNGPSHLLMKSIFTTISATTWIEDGAVYKYNPEIMPQPNNTVYKYPYNAVYLELYVPKDLDYWLALPNARIVGDDTLDGRAVTVVESTGDKSAATPQPNWEERSVADYKLWVDKETLQVLQRVHTTTFTAGRRTGTVETQTFRVSANQLEDAGQYPAGFFSFELPEGANVVDATPTSSEVTPSNETPTPMRGIAP